MAEQSGHNEPKTSGEATSISDTVSELLQNPTQTDIATTLGLLDDPSTLMLDPVAFLHPPSTLAASQTTQADHLTPQNLTIPTSLEALSSDLLQGMSGSMPPEVPSQQQTILPETATTSFVNVPPTTGAVDLSSIVQSIINQEQVGDGVAPSVVTKPTVTQTQPQSSSILDSIPIPSVTHIPQTSCTDNASTPQDSGEQSSGKEDLSSGQVKGTSLDDLCSSLPVGTSVGTPSQASPPSASTLPLPNVVKTDTEPRAVMDQVTPKHTSDDAGTSSQCKATTDAGSSTRLEGAPQLPTVQHESKPSDTRSVESTPSLSFPAHACETDEPKTGSTGESSVVSNSLLSTEQLQVSQSSPQPLVAHSSSQPQASTPSASRIPSASSTNLQPSTSGAGIQVTPQQFTNKSSGVQTASQPLQKTVQTSSTDSQAVSVSSSQSAPVNVNPKMVTPSLAAPVETPKTTITATPPTVMASTPSTTANETSQTNTTTTPKGLNLPILQFLQANFPALQLGNTSQDVFQVHTLLAHVLQQQQQLQQLQQQAQQQVQKAVASGQPLGTPTSGKSNILATPVTPASSQAQAAKPVQPHSSTSTASASSSSSASTQTVKQRTSMPVFAQVLPQVSTGGATRVTISQGIVGRPSPVVVPKKPKNGAGSFTSPLLLSRQKTKVNTTTLASVPMTSRSTQASTALSSIHLKKEAAVQMSTRTAAKQHHLSKTLIEPVDAEPMDIDVGEPFQILDLPPHLRDHSYSCYNPEEGERLERQRKQSIRVSSSIPPARVSYAPPLPDSPSTLYKLLKVIPKKATSRRSSAISSRTPSKRNRR